jgi:hypothetical protein
MVPFFTAMRRCTCATHKAEEAVQETLLAALPDRDRFFGGASVRTWLLRKKSYFILDFQYSSLSRRLLPKAIPMLERDKIRIAPGLRGFCRTFVRLPACIFPRSHPHIKHRQVKQTQHRAQQ